MKRRNFFKSFAIPLLSVAGVEAMAADAMPTTREQLIAWFERTFKCAQGYPGAYHTVDGELKAYQTYALKTDPLPGAEKLLVASVWFRFKTLVEKNGAVGSRMYWRLSDKIQLGRETSFEERVTEDESGGFTTVNYEYYSTQLRFRAWFEKLDDVDGLPVKPQGQPAEEFSV